MPATEQEILTVLGNPVAVDREIQEFRQTAQVLSSQHPRMIEEYPKQWIALYQEEVVARASTFKVLMAQIDERNLPRQNVVVRFIDRNQRTMIL